MSTINVYEIYKKVLLEKDENYALQVIGLLQQAKVIEVTSSIAIQAAKFSYENKVPMADSIIYITAKVNDAIVWTQDNDFKDLDGVKYFKKS
ncbi:MAG: type II toxin-antitoxin system VapC family toxin [Melioribacteraceae bacterium]|nr:type II toxin-antitoxin system VapC family toxin [Melioribacteraceae bacterium]